MFENKKNVCVDFDGVLNTHDGWKGEHVLFEPRTGVEKFLKELSYKFNVFIFTTRNNQEVGKWLQKYDLMKFVSGISDKKVPAIAYIDDRAIPFVGSFDSVLSQLIDNEFKTFWEMDIAEDFEQIDKMLNKKTVNENILAGFLEKKLPEADFNRKKYGEYIGVQMALGLITGKIPEFLPEPSIYREDNSFKPDNEPSEGEPPERMKVFVKDVLKGRVDEEGKANKTVKQNVKKQKNEGKTI